MKGHVPVLLESVLRKVFPVGCDPARMSIVDLTLGAGGYARAFLQRGAGRVVGVDRDPTQRATVEQLEKEFPGRFVGRCPLRWSGWRVSPPERETADAVVMDLGLCSTQIEERARGFSFRGSEADVLDMRMDGAQGAGVTASQLLSEAPQEELLRIFIQYGQEPTTRARALAEAVLRRREEKKNNHQPPVWSAGEAAALFRSVRVGVAPGRVLDPATRAFQALRICCNEEIEELVAGLCDVATPLLRREGRLVVVSYHSVEDRVVKKFLQLAGDRQVCAFGWDRREGPERPTEEEVAGNPRASSALLRWATRLSGDAPVREQLQRLALKRKV